MADAPISQVAEEFGIPRVSRLVDGAANNLRQLEGPAARSRGYELTNEDRLLLLNLNDIFARLLEIFDEYRRLAQGRRDNLRPPRVLIVNASRSNLKMVTTKV